MRTAAVDFDGNIIFRIKNETPHSDNAEDILEAIISAAERCRDNLTDAEIKAIAIAVPASVDYKNGLINKAPNLSSLDGFPIVESLRKNLGVKAVLENDANAAAIGENWLGASKGLENSITVTLGTGVGGGIIINGEILRGADGSAAEIGHICVEPFGHKCGCNSFGCVEQYASATAVVRQMKELANEFPPTKLKENLNSEDVYNAAKNGNESASEVFRRQGFYLGIMLAGLINTLNPEMIVIGGGAGAGLDLFLPSLQKEIFVRAYSEPAERAKIVRATLGEDAGLFGAAKLAINKG